MVSASRKQRMAAWHAGFLAMLPSIRRKLKTAFRHLDPEARAEAVQEGVCNAMAAYVRLHEREKSKRRIPRPWRSTPPVKFAPAARSAAS